MLATGDMFDAPVVARYLEQAFEEHDNNMPYITVDPIFDPVRQDPRFRALVARLGLPE